MIAREKDSDVVEIASVVGCWSGRFWCEEKRKDKGLARVVSVVLPLHGHRPRLGCLFLRHLRQAWQCTRVVASFRDFWEAYWSVVCSPFLWIYRVCVWNVKKDEDGEKDERADEA
jgi:hypothetical protein